MWRGSCYAVIARSVSDEAICPRKNTVALGYSRCPLSGRSQGVARRRGRNALLVPRACFSRRANTSGRRSSCSQIRNGLQPRLLSSADTRRSRFIFPFSFSPQKLLFVFGRDPCLGQPCQKQPSTNTATRNSRKTKSGRPKSGSLRLHPTILCCRSSRIRLSSVVRLPFPRTLDIISERFCRENTSTIGASVSVVRPLFLQNQLN
jgi:hypothetical protein